jgi:hypothetical protein
MAFQILALSFRYFFPRFANFLREAARFVDGFVVFFVGGCLPSAWDGTSDQYCLAISSLTSGFVIREAD